MNICCIAPRGAWLKLAPTAFVLGLALLLSGCGRSATGVAKTPEEARQAMAAAFAGASAAVKAEFSEAEAALKAQDDAKAFLQLNALSTRPDLTDEQRGATAQSMLSVNKKLNEAAANGDRNAAALLDSYRASK